MKNRVSFHTLGCRLNQSETDSLKLNFEQNGYAVVPETEHADVCVVNTCTVTEHSDAKNRQLIRRLHRLNPEAIIAVTGCYAQMDSNAVAGIEGVRLVVGNQEKMKITEYLNNLDINNYPLIVRPKITREPFATTAFSKEQTFKKNNFSEVHRDSKTQELISENSGQGLLREVGKKYTRAMLKIQDGCDFMCTFCIIPFARGRSRYREFSNLQDEARRLVSEGVREIVITGVNIGTYKNDKKNIIGVVDFLNNIQGLSRIRISSIEPTTVPETLFEYMSDPQHKLVPFFHLPLQSGSDSVLNKMRRRYSSGEYADEIWKAYEAVPDLCIGTDVMVGFPEEISEEFECTKNLLNKLPIAYFHVFPFSARKGTPAYSIGDKVLPSIKQQRGEELRKLSIRKRHEFHSRFLGQIRKVLWESPDSEGNISGYTDNYIRVILNKKGCYDFQNRILPARLLSHHGQNVTGVNMVN
tara:strand:- start:329 stop:1735 length:1407 start_codon:yes stop_codon:yes gene_type:complete